MPSRQTQGQPLLHLDRFEEVRHVCPVALHQTHQIRQAVPQPDNGLLLRTGVAQKLSHIGFRQRRVKPQIVVAGLALQKRFQNRQGPAQVAEPFLRFFRAVQSLRPGRKVLGKFELRCPVPRIDRRQPLRNRDRAAHV